MLSCILVRKTLPKPRYPQLPVPRCFRTSTPNLKPIISTNNSAISVSKATGRLSRRLWQRHGFMTRTAQAYTQAQRTRPYRTQFITVLLSGEIIPSTTQRIKEAVPVSVVNALKVWPLVTAFSFAFVPLEFRTIYTGVMSIGWQTYLSYLNRQAEIRQAERGCEKHREMIDESGEGRTAVTELA